jgi:transcriptional regulator with XRE-family HTH domain
MKQPSPANQIKNLRNRKGYSQEVLAEKAGLSLRTIQRIENGETEPRGDSLKRLAEAFEVTPDELVDWTVQEDTGFLMSMNLSALSYLIFPVLGILIPFIIWVSKKGKIQQIDSIAKELLNFQISLNILWILGTFAIPLFYVLLGNPALDDLPPFNVSAMVGSSFVWILITNLYNIVMVLLNTYRIHKSWTVLYSPKFRFLKK